MRLRRSMAYMLRLDHAVHRGRNKLKQRDFRREFVVVGNMVRVGHDGFHDRCNEIGFLEHFPIYISQRRGFGSPECRKL
jgi:hypothetical protein